MSREVSVDMAKDRLQDQEFVHSLRSVHRSLWRSTFRAGGFTSCLKY